MALLPKPKILSVVMNKGGVGKTTSVANLLSALVEMPTKGERPVVAAIDLDPQCNLSTILGLHEIADEQSENGWVTIAEFIDPENREVHAGEFFYPVPRPFFEERAHILLSHPDLETIKDDTEFQFKYQAGGKSTKKGVVFDVERYQALKREFFKEFRSRLINDLAGKVDYILIDTPPSLGFLTQLALSVSDFVLPAMSPGVLELDGLTAMEELIGLVWSEFQPELQVVGVLVNELFEREVLTQDVLSKVRERYASKGVDLFLRAEVPRSARIGQATSNSWTVFELDHPDAPAMADKYRAIVRELHSRVLLNQTTRAVSAKFFYELHAEQDEPEPTARALNG